MDGGIIFDEGHKVKGAADSVSTCVRRHWTPERLKRLEGRWQQLESLGVETDGHVTQWQRWEMNGDEKEGKNKRQRAAECKAVFKPRGAESWTGG